MRSVAGFLCLAASAALYSGSASAAPPDECIDQCERSHTECSRSKGERLHEIACGVRSLKCIELCRSKSR